MYNYSPNISITPFELAVCLKTHWSPLIYSQSQLSSVTPLSQ